MSLENDADAAALGEYWAGAGIGAERMYMVTLGTGIGTALIYHGEIYRGLDDAHPDGGHQILDPAGPICYCGAAAAGRVLASGAAIGRNARARLAEHPDTLIYTLSAGNPEQIDARLVAEAAFQGDKLALSMYQQAARYFALGIVNVITLFVPDVIVLGGGVMKSSPLFLPVLTQEIAGHNIMVPAMKVKIATCSAWEPGGGRRGRLFDLTEDKGKLNLMATLPYIEEILSQPDVLKAMLQNYDRALLDDVRKAVQSGRYDRIILTGMGASIYGVYPAYLLLAGLGLPVHWLDAAELLHYSPALIGSRTLLWITSQSGRSAELIPLIDYSRCAASRPVACYSK